MFIYPITIVLIILNVISNKYTASLVFKTVVLATFIFSIPDFLEFIIGAQYLIGIKNIIPLANHHLGWVLPASLCFILTNLIKTKKSA